MSSIPTKSTDLHPLRIAAGLVAIAAIATLIMWPGIRGPLAFDDAFMPEHVGAFTSWTDAFKPDVFQLYRPVKNLFFHAVYNLGGDPLLFHSLTFAAFLLAMTGVYTLTRRLFDSRGWGLAAAALFTFSASNATVALWSSCFNISIAAAAMTYGLTAWDRWRKNPARKIDAALFFALLALGLFSYESAIAMAPLAVLIDLFRGRRLIAKEAMLRYGMIAATVVGWFLLRHFSGAKSSTIGNPSLPPDTASWQLTASAPYFLWAHLQMWIAPWGRLECLGSYIWNRSIPASILPFCWMLLIGVGVLCLRFWKAGNFFVFGLAWFFVVSFPSGNFVPLGNTPYADYYTTLPSIGLCIALVAILRRLTPLTAGFRSRTPQALVACAVLVLLIGWRLAVIQEQRTWSVAWGDPVEVMARTAEARPYQYLAEAAVADYFVEIDPEIASRYATRATTGAPWLASPHLVLGDIALARGENDEAINHFRNAVRAKHLASASALKSALRLGQAIGRDPKRADEAFACLLPVLKEHDSQFNIEAALSASKIFANADRPTDRLNVLKRGLEVHPGDPKLLEALSQIDKAPGPDAS